MRKSRPDAVSSEIMLDTSPAVFYTVGTEVLL